MASIYPDFYPDFLRKLAKKVGISGDKNPDLPRLFHPDFEEVRAPRSRCKIEIRTKKNPDLDFRSTSGRPPRSSLPIVDVDPDNFARVHPTSLKLWHFLVGTHGQTDGQAPRQKRIPSVPTRNSFCIYVRGMEGNSTNPTKFLPLHFVK